MEWSQLNFARGTTAVLSWHVQDFVAMRSLAIKLQLIEFSIESELLWKNVSEMGSKAYATTMLT